MTTTFTKPGIRSLLVQDVEQRPHPRRTALLLTNGRSLTGQLLDYDDAFGLLCFAEEQPAPSLPTQPRYYRADLHIDVNHVIGVRFLEPTP